VSFLAFEFTAQTVALQSSCKAADLKRASVPNAVLFTIFQQQQTLATSPPYFAGFIQTEATASDTYSLGFNPKENILWHLELLSCCVHTDKFHWA
ncbi:hypothetical protein NDU88_010567, partial [Pleurodeles waltl]